jgi:hypothetical protein
MGVANIKHESRGCASNSAIRHSGRFDGRAAGACNDNPIHPVQARASVIIIHGAQVNVRVEPIAGTSPHSVTAVDACPIARSMHVAPSRAANHRLQARPAAGDDQVHPRRAGATTMPACAGYTAAALGQGCHIGTIVCIVAPMQDSTLPDEHLTLPRGPRMHAAPASSTQHEDQSLQSQNQTLV